ncbi:MAG: sigma-70 family RNA polymerase sigma factor [Muribaculaceae bacterium]|nr:sigma-70 family RNA polymerase sigma factor [Muribaculaceae bacterium]
MAEVPFTTDDKFLEDVSTAVLQEARKRYGSSRLSPEDLTQEAMLVTFEKVHNGTLTRLTSSLKTYMIGVLKKIGLEAQREKTKFVTVNNQPGQSSDDAIDPVDIVTAQKALDRWHHIDVDEERDEMQKAVYDIVVNMQDPCKTILWNYYWEGNSMREIAAAMNYNNARVATTQKSRCMTKVKKAMDEILKRMRS